MVALAGIGVVRWALGCDWKCNGPITFQLQGLIKAPIDMNRYSWFTLVKLINCDPSAAELSMAKDKKLGQTTAVIRIQSASYQLFDFVTNSIVQGISSINSKAFHMNVLGCKDLKFISVKISAPGNSVNTDGIHIGESTGISVAHSIIGTGDDCISIGPGNNDINIFDVQCGPGHGISIGSLGKYTNEEPVKGVVVQHCTLIGTDNGVRIKTWPDSPKQGIATNLTFDDIIMKNVQNPIIIDQQYCPFGSCNQKKSSLIQISKVKFNNIQAHRHLRLR
ncbi:hypothetical protein Scep_011877 [Stephania cephalantha]|uniref:Polygalacturonase n=1 Tax=Stephania cephalantha TaxID=152367 RepID=A0AAP0JE71_9MAGN